RWGCGDGWVNCSVNIIIGVSTARSARMCNTWPGMSVDGSWQSWSLARRLGKAAMAMRCGWPKRSWRTALPARLTEPRAGSTWDRPPGGPGRIAIIRCRRRARRCGFDPCTPSFANASCKLHYEPCPLLVRTNPTVGLCLSPRAQPEPGHRPGFWHSLRGGQTHLDPRHQFPRQYTEGLVG